jgi:glyoxylase-like metal-dependent hydrolase (beta-lactamase superfamily II)
MLNGEIKLYEVGYCKHPEFVTVQGGEFKSVKFPAMAALIPTTDGNILFDSGYGEHFYKATDKFPEKFYALTTPVTLATPLCKQIAESIKNIFISHFHADHIGGLRDFEGAKFLCSKEALDFAMDKSISRFSKTKQGVLPYLLPENFLDRVSYIEDLPKVDLPKEIHPFTKGYLWKDGIYIVELKGHAKGQYGLYVEDYFFVSDAVWDMRTISQNRLPHFITRFIMDDYKEYLNTIKMLQELYKQNPNIKIIPTHCKETLKRYSDV